MERPRATISREPLGENVAAVTGLMPTWGAISGTVSDATIELSTAGPAPPASIQAASKASASGGSCGWSRGGM